MSPAPAGPPSFAQGRRANALRLQRLRDDKALLQRTHPALTFGIDEPAATAVASGPIEIELPDGSIEPIEVRIEFGAGYPHRAPNAYDARSLWAPDPDRHIESDGRMCLFLRGIDEPRLHDRPDGLSEVMRELTSFIAQQLILDSQLRFDPNARFPGPEWAHGDDAYKSYVIVVLAAEPEALRAALWRAAVGQPPRREDPCLCGADALYGDCHAATRKRLRRALHAANMHNITYADLLAYAASTS